MELITLKDRPKRGTNKKNNVPFVSYTVRLMKSYFFKMYSYRRRKTQTSGTTTDKERSDEIFYKKIALAIR